MGTLRFLTAGESHGKCLTAIVEGLPAGVRIDLSEMNQDMVRRQQGYGRGGRMKIEADCVEILSGVRFGETTGAPVTLCIKNKDWENWTERMSVEGGPAGELVTAARPGHADLTGIKKYARKDIRDILERASARETAGRVAAGALAKQFLKVCGMTVVSQVINIGGVHIAAAETARGQIGRTLSELNCYDAAAEEKMRVKIRSAKAEGDTLGGIFEVFAQGIPAGLGSYIQWDRRLDARLAGALMSIQAIKGVEIGEGFGYAALPGSLAHDEMFYDAEHRVYRKTNHAGGIEGGMSNGEEIVLRAVMKPIPTLMKPLHSVDIQSHEAVLACKERSDVCAVSAASVVGEAMTAFVLAEAVIEKFGGDAMTDLLAGMKSYKERVYGE
jgi:chorismate synthase